MQSNLGLDHDEQQCARVCSPGHRRALWEVAKCRFLAWVAEQSMGVTLRSTTSTMLTALPITLCLVCVCRYFARVAEERMGPDDAVILVTHAPRWLTEWCVSGCYNLAVNLHIGMVVGNARWSLSWATLHPTEFVEPFT